ncbi:MAG: hypothetical protein ABIQ29_06550 [Burkholderiaceae bacterium]
MWKSFSAAAAAMLTTVTSPAADLTDTERRWLHGIAPVLSFARSEKLPLDVIVQPQPTPGVPPLALAFVDGRCKLVLSMRGNPEAQAALERIDASLLDATLELMAAHELGHCRRYLDGGWYSLPARFQAESPLKAPGSASSTAEAEWRAERREEGFADLMGLAWTRRQHPGLYPALYAWLIKERTAERVPGGPHDTIAWLRLAENGASLDAPSGPMALWLRGLGADMDD